MKEKRYLVKVWHKSSRSRVGDLELETNSKVDAVKHAKELNKNLQKGTAEIKVIDRKPFEQDGEIYGEKLIYSNQGA